MSPLLALAATLVTSPALATDTALSPYITSYEEQVLDVDDYDYDSDWVPEDSSIQVRLEVHAGNTIAIFMDGDAVYDWDAEAIDLEGALDGGLFELDLGLTITSSLRFDILGYGWEGEVGEPIDWWVYDEALFLPYLLEGNPDRPLEVYTEVPKETVVEYTAIDLYVASGTLRVDVSGELDTVFATNSVTVTPLDGGEDALLVTEGTGTPLVFAEGEDAAEAEAQLEGDVQFTPSLSAWPSVVIDLFGSEYTLAEFEVPLDMPAVEDVWTFEPEWLGFERPVPEDEHDDTADEGAGDDTGAIESGGKDCGCASTNRGVGGLGWGLLFVLGVAGAGRRSPCDRTATATLRRRDSPAPCV